MQTRVSRRIMRCVTMSWRGALSAREGRTRKRGGATRTRELWEAWLAPRGVGRQLTTPKGRGPAVFSPAELRKAEMRKADLRKVTPHSALAMLLRRPASSLRAPTLHRAAHRVQRVPRASYATSPGNRVVKAAGSRSHSPPLRALTAQALLLVMRSSMVVSLTRIFPFSRSCSTKGLPI